MIPTDYNTDFDYGQINNDFEVREDYETYKIEDSFDETDSYNFYPDAAF